MLTKEQFLELRRKGLTVDQITRFERGEKPVNLTEEKEEGTISSIIGALKGRVKDVGETYKEFEKGEITPIESGIRTVGAVAGGVGDIVGGAIIGAGKALLPKVAEKGIKKGVEYVASSAPVQYLSEKYGEFAEEYPRTAKVTESVANIAMAVPALKGVGIAGKTAGTAAKTTAKQVAKTATKVFGKTAKEITDYAYIKAIKPTVAGKRTVTAINRAKDNFNSAMDEIISRKETLNLFDDAGEKVILPETLSQTSDAIDQTKRAVFKEYSALKGKAATQQVDLSDIVNDLRTYATENVALRTENPTLAKYLLSKANQYEKLGTYTVEQADEAAKILQDNSKSFFKQSSWNYNDLGKSTIDLKIAQKLRQKVDDVILKETDQSYQALKNKYSSLRAIEEEVGHRAIVNMRKDLKGLFDYAVDIPAALSVLSTVATGDISGVIKGGLMVAIKNWYKNINNPNSIIRSMFKKLDKIKTRELEEAAEAAAKTNKIIPYQK